MEKTEIKREWEPRVAVFKASGQTQSKWCQINNLSPSSVKVLVKED